MSDTPEERGEAASLPSFDPEPELIDDLEGSGWTRRRYQRAARVERERAQSEAGTHW